MSEKGDRNPYAAELLEDHDP